MIINYIERKTPQEWRDELTKEERTRVRIIDFLTPYTKPMDFYSFQIKFIHPEDRYLIKII